MYVRALWTGTRALQVYRVLRRNATFRWADVVADWHAEFPFPLGLHAVGGPALGAPARVRGLFAAAGFHVLEVADLRPRVRQKHP